MVSALEGASFGAVEEGSVGAGTGPGPSGGKGGIGTASRILPETQGGWTVGVLVQSNFGGILTVAGAPVGQALGRYSFQADVEAGRDAGGESPSRRRPDRLWPPGVAGRGTGVG